MQITDVLRQMGGIQSIARELGVSEAQAADGAAALAPAVLGGFKKQAQAQPSGLDGLGGMLGKLGGGGLLDDLLGSQPTNLNRGNDVLGQIFGSKDVSRAVAQNASANTGLSTDTLKKMLPMVAMAVAGYLAKQKERGAPLNQPAPGDGRAASGGAGLGGALGGLLQGGGQDGTRRAGGLASMLDMDGNGNPLDDIMRMVGKLGR